MYPGVDKLTILSGDSDLNDRKMPQGAVNVCWPMYSDC